VIILTLLVLNSCQGKYLVLRVEEDSCLKSCIYMCHTQEELVSQCKSIVVSRKRQEGVMTGVKVFEFT